MHPSAAWLEFLSRQASGPPLLYMHGMRHTVSVGPACAMHSHHAIEIVYHPTGAGATRLQGGRGVPFGPGSVIIYAPDEVHDQVMDCEGEDLCVQLGLPAESEASKIPTGSCFEIPAMEDATLIEDLRLLSQGHIRLDPIQQGFFNLRATSTLLALIHLSMTRSDHQDQWHVLKAEQYIRDHFSKIGTLREVAAHVGISHDYLRHRFRALRRKSMIRYLNEIRIERARTLLVYSGLPLSQIAEMCGFKDEYYFSAVFRKLAAWSPGHYRNTHRQAG